MRRWLSLPLLCFLLLPLGGAQLVTSVNPPSAWTTPATAAHHIHMESEVEGASCSSVAVGPHTLLTAGHCVVGGTDKIYIDKPDNKYTINNVVYDEKDHALLTINSVQFDSYLGIDERKPVPNEEVHFYGWPGHAKSAEIRQGQFVETQEIFEFNDPVDIYSVIALPGDSGSGVVDSEGKVITVVSVGDNSGNMGAFELNFTPEQLAQTK